MSQTIDLNTQLARRVVGSVKSRLKILTAGEHLTIGEICNPGLWSSLTPGQRKQAGRIIAAAVQQGRLSLKSMGRNQSNHQIYGIP